MPLLLAGVGVWALVIGPFVGNLAAILAAWRTLAVRAAAAARPCGGAPLPALLVAGVRDRRSWRWWSRRARSRSSGSSDGLVAAGWITLAATLTRYADRADQILATTIYPAIVRVRDRVDVLEELFEKANRLTLMWAFPFGAGLALFGADLIVFVLGDDWRGAIVLLGGLAVAVALQQVGYCWFAFYRARGRVVAAGGRVGRVRRRVRRCSRSRARCSAGRGGSSSGRMGCTLCVLAVRARLRAAAAAGRAAAARWPRGRRCRSRSPRRPCSRSGWRCGAGSGRSRRRCSSWRCGSAGSRWRPAGSSAACSPSCAATWHRREGSRSSGSRPP